MIDKLGKFTEAVSSWLNWVAGAGVVAMLGLTVADVIGVKFFKQPVPGSIELVGFLDVVVIAFAIAYTLIVHGHIEVNFFVLRLPKRLRASVNALVSLLGIALFLVLAWRSYDFARVLQTTGEVSMTQRIPFYPFVYAIAFCCLPVCLALLVDFLKAVVKAVGK